LPQLSHDRDGQPVPHAPPPVPRQKVSLSRQLPLALQHPFAHVAALQGWQAPPAQPLGQYEVELP
jgi:hypothetical protein